MRLIRAVGSSTDRALYPEFGRLENPLRVLSGLRNARIFRLRRFWMALLIPLSAGLTHLAASNPGKTEWVYSRGIYPVLSGILGRMGSAVPFSVTEGMVFLLPAALLAYITVQAVNACRYRPERRERLAKIAAMLFCTAGAGYFLFTVFCGLNYHRLSFAEAGGLEVRPSSAAELASLCDELVLRANSLRGVVTEDAGGVMESSFGDDFAAAVFAQGAYQKVGEAYPALSGYTARPKPVALSRGMSYLDITGIYMPFTFEANVNTDIPDYWIPSTMMHELAHYKGYMREDEANFISYLACSASGNADFEYSGVMLALIHTGNALYSADKELYWPVMEQLSDGVRRDMTANAAYWQRFEGPVAEASTAMNDVYLKSNRQENGVKSYGRMVDLLLAEYRERHGIA